GLLACGFVITVFCAEHLRDTLLLRPHPAFWRWVLGCGLLYAAAMAFALFQSIDDLRSWVRFLDPDHISGSDPLAEKSYGEDCSFTWANLVGTMDEFVLAHALGWYAKALMFRDVWLALAASFLFEMLEYTFESYLPNFIECWWDHLLLDFLGCNAIGLVAGHLTMRYLQSKEYNWGGIRQINSVSAAVQRG
ncbi:ptdss2, partial [Symbiodinium sp. KB8]